MAAKIFFLLAAIAIASAAPPAAEKDPLKEIEAHAGEFTKMVTEQFNKISNSKNTEEFNKVLKENTDDLLSKISEFTSSVNKALEETNDKAKATFSEATSKLQQTVEDLRKQNPQVEEGAKKIGEDLRKAVTNTISEADKLAKNLSTQGQEISEKVAPVLKEQYESFVKKVEEVQKNIHEAATKETKH